MEMVIMPADQLRTMMIEAASIALRYHQPAPATTPDADPFGDFNWLTSTCSGVPASTLRIHSAAGKIPGVVKFGKRVLYEKAAVLNWLRSQTRQAVDIAQIEQSADQQINTQLRKQSHGGRKVA